MARPIHANADATREQILHAATHLFADCGLEGTTMRQIAQHAGVSMATVHHYFGGKAGLYEACTAAYLADLLALEAEVRQTMGQARTLAEAAELVVRRAWAFVRTHRPMVRLMVRNVVDTGETRPETRDESLRPMLEQGASLLAPLLGRPELEVRLALTSIMYLVARFALNSEVELALLVGAQEGAWEEVSRQVEAYLVTASRRLLGIEQA